ncbi:CCA tRNA nucleotidyltransferase [Flavisphingomonas formosensis]|uniref:CCA tRNA nucleotidyltransferase n=1 Tax=Flavisphingomonas formosensis TaxID=861534 RepID=UPI0012F82EC8|nr:CCA tRNA nucleotidyltransferase [Sphingomonas formosensis]
MSTDTYLPDAEWRSRPGLAELLDVLGGRQGQIRFVGGAVRDTLLSLPVADIDCATVLLPQEVLDRVRQAGLKAVPTGIAHGTITAVTPGGPVEVTTLRRDVSTDGRRATVAFTEDWQEDAARRDFTINALSAEPVSGRIHDYFGGLADLCQGRVRFIGEPLTRIAEDHLRILRFFRFHARFGKGAPDADALAACAARANDLMALSRERIADELLKLLAVEDPAPAFATMLEHGIWRPVLPEIDLQGLARLRALIERERAAGLGPDPLRRLAALLPPDPPLATALAVRLKLSNAAQRRLAAAAGRTEEVEPLRALAYRLGREEAIDRLLLSERDVAALAELEGWDRPRLPLGGGDLIAMGLPAGPVVAKTLQAVEARWIAEDFPAHARALALAQEAVDQLLRPAQ